MPGHDPILFDLGTGLRYFGNDWPADRPFRGSCLLSHLHWDHVQGLPFFQPILRDGARIDVYAPVQPGDQQIAEILDATITPPMFPVQLGMLPGEIDFHEKGDEEFMIGDVIVTSRLIPHVGNTCGYRLDWGGHSAAYLSDHQQPGVDVYEASPGALELCRDVDVLIHDAQYTRDEFVVKSDWGHCTIDYAHWLATEANAKQLVMYHHDPTHDDDQIDAFVEQLRDRSCSDGPDVIAAREGLIITVGG